jgi:tetratricopeptide (TPR) repeat protein
VGTAKCVPYGQTLTYWPLRGLLETLVGGPPGKAELAGVFISAGSEPEDAGRLSDHVLATLGIELNSTAAQQERETVFNAWRLLTEAFAWASPLVVVFEDLHWASDSLLDLVEHIMHPRTAAPLMIVALSRPELLDRRPGWGGGRRSFTSLALDPLTHDQTVQLVGGASRPLAPAIRERIAERSGGNPFFALELVRGLAERGIGAGHSQAEAAAAESLPDTVHAAVLARLDLLSPVERKVVQAASVAGRAFRTAALTALLADVPKGEIEDAIDELLVRDLIALADGGTFTFRHILTRDVAYGTLSRKERIRMHSATAAWLEVFAAGRIDQFVELIAYHYREAAVLARRSAIPIDLPHETERAVFYLERAGWVAGAAGGFAEAAEHLRDAIELAAEAERARLYEVMGDAAPFGDSAIAAYQQALDRWRRDGAREPLVGARLMRKQLTIYMRWLGSVSTRPSRGDMIAMRREAWRLAKLAGDQAETWRLKTADLFWYFWSSELPAETTEDVLGVDDAMRVPEAAADYFERRAEWDTLHTVLDASQGIARQKGDLRRQAAVIERRLAVPQTSRFEWGDALNMRTWAHSDAGEFDRAVDLMREAAGDLRPGEPIVHLSNGLAMAAFAAMVSGRWSDVDELKVLLDQSWEELRHDAPAAYLSAGFGSILHVGLAREDRAMADSALAVLRPLVSFPDRHHLSVFVEAYVRDDPSVLDTIGEEHGGPVMFFILPFRLERGVIPSSTMVAAVRDHAAHTRVAQIYLPIAEAMHARDMDRLAAAIDAADAAGLTPHAARMRIVLARLSGDPSPLESARSTLTALGDRQFLARLEEVEAALGARSLG